MPSISRPSTARWNCSAEHEHAGDASTAPDGQRRYALRHTHDEHVHLVCSECGAVIEVDAAAGLLRLALPSARRTVSRWTTGSSRCAEDAPHADPATNPNADRLPSSGHHSTTRPTEPAPFSFRLSVNSAVGGTMVHHRAPVFVLMLLVVVAAGSRRCPPPHAAACRHYRAGRNCCANGHALGRAGSQPGLDGRDRGAGYGRADPRRATVETTATPEADAGRYRGPSAYGSTPLFEVAYDPARWEYVEDDGSGRPSQLKHRTLTGCALWLRAGPLGATPVASVYRTDQHVVDHLPGRFECHRLRNAAGSHRVDLRPHLARALYRHGEQRMPGCGRAGDRYVRSSALSGGAFLAFRNSRSLSPCLSSLFCPTGGQLPPHPGTRSNCLRAPQAPTSVVAKV